MKVLLINGSPHEFGCTYTALKEVSDRLNTHQIETEIFHIGKKPVGGCIGCGGCKANNNRCIFQDAPVNQALDIMESCQGLIVGSPVYYASANGSLSSFMDRFFYTGNSFRGKVGAAVASARRAGTTATLDQIQKYFTIAQMPIVSSQYWNMVHGQCPEDVAQDLEGLQTMRVLADHMAWLLKCIEAGEKAGISLPEQEERKWTNFIR